MADRRINTLEAKLKEANKKDPTVAEKEKIDKLREEIKKQKELRREYMQKK